MIRPKLNDTYLFTIKDKELLTYILEIGHYCDELERKLSGHNILVKFADDLFADNKELNKALDKACKFISDVHSCPLDTFDFELEGGCDSVCLERTKDSSLCWKEWALNNEKTE